MSDERKYEILPGVELPDIKSIINAASDFSASGVDGIEVKARSPISEKTTMTAGPTPDDIAALQKLGTQVAADEERQAAESRARMNAILSSAVQAPETITNLKRDNVAKVTDEERERLEAELRAEEERKAEEEAKNRAREERRLLQQKMLEEARERAAREALEKQNNPGSESESEVEAETESDTVAKEPVAASTEAATIPGDSSIAIASDEETFDDFSEFLDDKGN